MSPTEPYLISFLHLPDATGTLVTTQDATGLPFVAKRVFWVYTSEEGGVRGGHAHRTTQELLVVLKGSVRVETETAQGKRIFNIDTPTQGLYIPPLCWITVHPSPGAILCCMTSTVFDEADYLREYDAFKQVVQ